MSAQPQTTTEFSMFFIKSCFPTKLFRILTIVPLIFILDTYTKPKRDATLRNSKLLKNDSYKLH